MVIVDIEKLKDLSIQEFTILINVHNKEPVTDIDILDKLENEGWIKIGDNIILRQKAIDLINSVTKNINIESKINKNLSSREINQIIENNAHILRNKWKGLKLGSMGSLSALKLKLKRWMEKNPNYTFEDILRAADVYIASLNGNYKYLQQADYFIYKKVGKEESSRLDAFIDEQQIDNDDWTNKLI